MSYDGGDMVRVSVAYTASGGGQVDPASVIMQLMNPLGSVSTWGYPASIVRDAQSLYYADVLASIGGDWHYRWAGLQTNWAAGEGTFTVNKTLFIL